MSKETAEYKDKLFSFRHLLHKHPELSHNEKETKNRIINFLKEFPPDNIIENIGGYGLAAVYNGIEPGQTVAVRTDMDALPIDDNIDKEYKSIYDDAGHKCGHDGHIVMVSGLAPLLYKKRTRTGRVVLVYQPAEETGEGANLMLADDKFNEINPDYFFALHNLPGFKKGDIIIRKGVFASASVGLTINLKGATSHAGEPVYGRNPALAASQIVQSLLSIPTMNTPLHEAALITPVQVKVGRKAFGTSAGDAELMFTLRAHSDKTLKNISVIALQQAKRIAHVYDLGISTIWVERFDAVKNDKECVNIINEAATMNGHNLEELERPFPWSEDFGYFTGKFKGALFGLGAGKHHPALHNDDYDFPDEIIQNGINMFHKIIRNILD